MKNNRKEKTILVSGASGIIGYGILKSLRQSEENLTLIGTTIYSDSAAQGFCDIFEKAPLTDDNNYISWLIDIINKHQVDMIIPSIESDVIAWNQHKETLNKTNCVVLLNTSNLINLCADKWLFYEELKKHNSEYTIPTSMVFDEKKHKFPFLLKPRHGSASKGVVIVENDEMLALYKADIGKELIIQPIVGSLEEEYTTSAFFDSDSKLCFFMSLKRKLSKDGYTEKAIVQCVDEMEETLIDLGKIFKPVGPTNFQFRIENGQLKLLEINPRISSATSIRSSFGYNESVMSVDYFLYNKILQKPRLQNGYAVRYIEDMIFYDCLDS